MNEFQNLWILPIITSILCLVGIIVPYAIGAANGNIPAFLNVVSDGGAFAPEKSIFSLFLSISAVMIMLTAYIKHVQFVAYYESRRPDTFWRRISTATMIIGCIAAAGLAVLGNFSIVESFVVHNAAAGIAFVSAILYLCFTTGLSFLRPLLCSRWIAFIRVALTVLAFVFLLFHQITQRFLIFVPAGTNVTKRIGGYKPEFIVPDSPFYINHIVASSSEWLLAFVFFGYFATFAEEFRKSPLTLPSINFLFDPSSSTTILGQNKENEKILPTANQSGLPTHWQAEALYLEGPDGEYYRIDQENVVNGGKPLRVLHEGELPEGAGLALNLDGRISIQLVYNIDEVATLDCEPYRPLHPRKFSLGSCRNDSEAVVFPAAVTIPLQLKQLQKKLGRSSESERVVIYHGHLLWSYKLRLTHEQGNAFSLSIASAGPHLREPTKRGLENTPKDLGPPRILEANLCVIDPRKERIELELARSSECGFCARKQFNKQELRDLADDDFLYCEFRMVIPRSYFNVASMIDLSDKTAARAATRAEAANKSTVALILRGKTPRDSDYQITGSHEDKKDKTPIPCYAVYKSTIMSASSFLKKMNMNHKAVLSGFSDVEVRMVIQVAYGVDVPLPVRTIFAKLLFKRLQILFEDHFTARVIPQWERAICRAALALDTRSSSSMVDLLHLLNLIFSAPYGFFPVAKRITIGVLADLAHLNARTSLQQWVQDEVLPHLGASHCEIENVVPIVTAFLKIMDVVPYVKRRGFTGKDHEEEKNKEEEEEEEEEEAVPPESIEPIETEIVEEYVEVTCGNPCKCVVS